MTIGSVTEPFELLGRNPELLVGEVETPWLDFKREPYSIVRSAKGFEFHRQQLAKDIAVLSRNGGVIVIGVETEFDNVGQVELATKLRPVSHGSLDPKQIQDVVWEWVFPKLNVEVRPHDIPDSAGQLWTIYVDKQRERDLPFVLKKVVTGLDGTDDSFFGVFERAGTHNTSYSPEQVHGWIQRGYKAEVQSEPAEAATDQLAAADEVLWEDLAALNLGEGDSYYCLQAAPRRPAPLRRFYTGGADSLQELMHDLPQLRSAGFNLPDGVEPQRTTRGALRVAWQRSDSLSVARTGIVTAVQGQEHLTWASQNFARKGEAWINPIALVEYTIEFWRFCFLQVVARMDAQSPLFWRARMGNLLEPAPLFLPHRTRRSSERHEAVVPEFETDWTETATTHPGQAAFDTLSAVYGHFGWSEDAIPLVEGGRVSEQAIVDLKRRR